MAAGRLSTNLAVFHTDYRDLQVQSFLQPGVPDISNAGSATIRGVEVEVDAAAGHGLHLAGHVSWLEATYDSYLAKVPGGATRDAAGNRLNNAPEWSGSGSAVYEFAAWQRGNGPPAWRCLVAEPRVLHAVQHPHRDTGRIWTRPPESRLRATKLAMGAGRLRP